jgi:hypothetical protein
MSTIGVCGPSRRQLPGFGGYMPYRRCSVRDNSLQISALRVMTTSYSKIWDHPRSAEKVSLTRELQTFVWKVLNWSLGWLGTALPFQFSPPPISAVPRHPAANRFRGGRMKPPSRLHGAMRQYPANVSRCKNLPEKCTSFAGAVKQ